MSIQLEALQHAYVQACEVELQAFKPGNVSVYSAGHDMTVDDFRRSAQASAPFVCDPALSLGEKIFRAVQATRQAVGCNTNLGIVLLAAPLLQACAQAKPGIALRQALPAVLGSTTRQDADWVYQAIRLASPGGLGETGEQDVQAAPSVTLYEAMALAAGRDRIAWQYTNSYATIFDLAIPGYHSGLSLWHDEAWAAATVFAGLLKAIPDSHVERKFGTRFSPWVAEQMALADQALSTTGSLERTLRLLREIDAGFKAVGINPGTTADLTVACLLTVRLEKLLMACEPSAPGT